jgi:hypothetical protein
MTGGRSMGDQAAQSAPTSDCLGRKRSRPRRRRSIGGEQRLLGEHECRRVPHALVITGRIVRILREFERIALVYC